MPSGLTGAFLLFGAELLAGIPLILLFALPSNRKRMRGWRDDMRKASRSRKNRH